MRRSFNSPVVNFLFPVSCLSLLILLSGCALLGVPTVDGCYPCAVDRAPSPANGAPLTRIIALGDFGTAEDGRNREVAAALQQFLAAARPEHVFELGDNFYDYGLIGTEVRCRDVPGPAAAVTGQALSVLQPFEFLRDQGITVTAIPGNHDYGCEDYGLQNQIDIDRWLPPAHQWGARWEVVSGLPQEIVLGGGAVQVIALDSHRMITDRGFRDESVRRLEALLGRGRDHYRWRILAAHHPLRTNGIHDGTWWEGTLVRLTSVLLLPAHALAALQVPPFDELSQEAYSIRYVAYREAVEEAVRRSGVPVTLFLGGHDHDLQLLEPHAAGQPFVLISGSAAHCSAVRVAGNTIFAAPKNGFAAISIYPEHLDIEFIGTTGCDEPAPCAHSADGQPHELFRYRVPAQD